MELSAHPSASRPSLLQFNFFHISALWGGCLLCLCSCCSRRLGTTHIRFIMMWLQIGATLKAVGCRTEFASASARTLSTCRLAWLLPGQFFNTSSCSCSMCSVVCENPCRWFGIFPKQGVSAKNRGWYLTRQLQYMLRSIGKLRFETHNGDLLSPVCTSVFFGGHWWDRQLDGAFLITVTCKKKMEVTRKSALGRRRGVWSLEWRRTKRRTPLGEVVPFRVEGVLQMIEKGASVMRDY